MFIFTNEGLFSIARDQDNNELLHVRARRIEDLRSLFPGKEVQLTPGRDYRYRVILSRAEAARTFANEIMSIDYTEFERSIRDIDFRVLCKQVRELAKDELTED
jgi:hypothetical protein